jgi:hypothetical protein
MDPVYGPRHLVVIHRTEPEAPGGFLGLGQDDYLRPWAGWSGIRESDPRLQLGKLAFCH